MSWRLQKRDLNGQWYFSEYELSLIKACLDDQVDSNVALSKHDHSWAQLSKSELNEKMFQMGQTWLQVYSAEQKQVLNQDQHRGGRRCTPRLKTVLDLHHPEHVNLDIGTDHAHLPLLLVKSKQAPLAFGIDIAKAPLQSADGELRRLDTDGQIALIHGDGWAPFNEQPDQPKQVYRHLNASNLELWANYRAQGKVTTTICGVGGYLASKLITSTPSWVSELIVQANDSPELVDQSICTLYPEFKLDAIRVTIDHQRLFLTKRIRRRLMKFSFNDTNPSPSEVDLFGIHQSLWYWVELSRTVRRLSLTPQSDQCYSAKYQNFKDLVHRIYSALSAV